MAKQRSAVDRDPGATTAASLRSFRERFGALRNLRPFLRPTMLGTAGYYCAYACIAFRTARGEFTIGDLTFLAGSFRRLRNLLEGLLIGFTQVAGQALYLDDLFSFFEIKPEIRSPDNPRPFPKPLREGFEF